MSNLIEKAKDFIENKEIVDKSMKVEPNFFDAERQRCLILKELAEDKILASQKEKLLELKHKHDSEMQDLYRHITQELQKLQESQRNEIDLVKRAIDPRYTSILQECNAFLSKLEKMEENNGNIHNE